MTAPFERPFEPGRRRGRPLARPLSGHELAQLRHLERALGHDADAAAPPPPGAPAAAAVPARRRAPWCRQERIVAAGLLVLLVVAFLPAGLRTALLVTGLMFGLPALAMYLGARLPGRDPDHERGYDR
ncbi:MAG: hypothetical protein ACT4RN_04935 [Pseudonocardia sp.]